MAPACVWWHVAAAHSPSHASCGRGVPPPPQPCISTVVLQYCQRAKGKTGRSPSEKVRLASTCRPAVDVYSEIDFVRSARLCLCTIAFQSFRHSGGVGRSRNTVWLRCRPLTSGAIAARRLNSSVFAITANAHARLVRSGRLNCLTLTTASPTALWLVP